MPEESTIVTPAPATLTPEQQREAQLRNWIDRIKCALMEIDQRHCIYLPGRSAPDVVQIIREIAQFEIGSATGLRAPKVKPKPAAAMVEFIAPTHRTSQRGVNAFRKLLTTLTAHFKSRERAIEFVETFASVTIRIPALDVLQQVLAQDRVIEQARRKIVKGD